jgi:peptide/nickel transport system substrate-binding protein
VIDRDASLVYAYTAGCNSLDPHAPIGGNDVLFMRPVYDRLVTVERDANGSVRLAPQLARGWAASDDGLTIFFELRPGVRFQDGTPFDASAVVANLKRAMSAESRVASVFGYVQDVDAVGPWRVAVHLSEPDPGLLWSFAVGTAGMMASPAHLGEATRMVGTGPFQLVSAAKDAEMVYERWKDHWDAGAALTRRLTILTLPDADARFEGTKRGTIHIGHLYPPASQVAKGLTSEGYTWHRVPSPVMYGVVMNLGMQPLDDVRVRRAIDLAIDRRSLSESVFGDLGPAMYQIFAPGVVGYDPHLDAERYDPERARSLIAEAGASGATVRCIVHAASPSVPIGDIVQASLATIGLRVEIVALSNTDALRTWRTGGFHADLGSIIAWPDPTQTVAGAIVGPDNPGTAPNELIDLANRARALPLGDPARETAYRAISAYLVDNPVHAPLAQFVAVYLCRPEVVGAERLLDIALTDFRGIGIMAA